MDTDIRAASRMLIDWNMTHGETPDDEKRSSLHSHSHSHSHSQSSPPQSPSSSPSFSSESESYPLSRCSSLSSLSSAYSDSDTSDTEDCSDDVVFLVSILKKPRPRRGEQQQQRCERQMSHQQDDSNSSGGKSGNSHTDSVNEEEGGANELREEDGIKQDDDDDWQDLDDDESDCDIIFERNVTFDDPLAIDIVTGVPVAPSSRSRVEWTAMQARERLERVMGFLGACGEQGQDDMSTDPSEGKGEHPDGEEESKIRAVDYDDDDDDMEVYVYNITELAAQSMEPERLR